MPKTKKPSWFGMRNAENGAADISIIGDIGGFGIGFGEFKRSLDALGTPKVLKISVNSDGGDVYTGFAIYNSLMRHPARKIVTVEGLAASMGSVVAMAGDERIMPRNATMMIHNPVGSISGESPQIIKFGESVAKMRMNIASAYADATLMPVDELLRMMDAQTWIGAEDALKMGFATKIEKPMDIAAYFDVSRYRNAPKSYGARSRKGVNAMTKRPAEDFESEELSADQVRAQVRDEMKTQNAKITALCKLAGLPECAPDFIAKDMSEADVLAELDALKAEKNGTKKKHDMTTARGRAAAKVDAQHVKPSDEINARNTGVVGSESKTILDPLAIYAKWNRKSVAA